MDDAQTYLKKHKVCDVMEQLVSGLLATQPQDPVLGAIYLLCEANNISPPKECPKPVTRVPEKAQASKKDEKKGKVDPREEALNRVAAEKEKRRKDEDEGMNFAAAF
eukprot:TRINITY_DN47835_c0_g1_i1.p2 TRINITY_DN47835_c0_g1~~TRINITY_DN47835_c0_g1_i1.p2  ORF type:complete len:117 (+),score=47.19 TRINITY_DN47835_c0_g1_i1:32-352(+)